MNSKRLRIILFSVIGLAFAIRIYSVFANLPFIYWHDENHYIDNALCFGNWNFKLITFAHGALYPMVLFLEYSVYYIIGKVTGMFQCPLDLYIGYLKDPTSFFLMARLTTILCGTGVVCLTYLIAKKVYDMNIGLVAGLFAGFSLLMVQMSSVALADVPSVFVLLLSFLALVVSIEKLRDDRVYYIAAILIGLSVACKYYTIFGVAPLYIAAYIKCRNSENKTRRFFSLVTIASFFIFLGFCIGMPFFLPNLGRFFREAFISNSGAYIFTNPNKNVWLFYFTHHLRNGFGISLGILSICGICYAIYKHSKWDILLISIPVAHYLIFMHSTGFAYHLLPAAPFMFILAARFLYVISGRIFPRLKISVFLCLGILVVLPMFIDSVKFMITISSPDTREAAKTWIGENIPAGAKILGEGYIAAVPIHGPAIIENMETLKKDLDDVVSKGGSGFPLKTKMAHFSRLYGEDRTYNIFKAYALSADDVRRANASYIITTGDNDNPTGPELSYYLPDKYYAERRKMMDAVLARYSLIKSFMPSKEMTSWIPHLTDKDYEALRAVKWGSIRHYVKGPRIDIFKLKK